MVLFTIKTLSILPLFIPTIAAQFIPPPKDLIQTYGHLNISIRYKAVPPSICPLPPSVKSFTGYADVAENQHLFFWFFEAIDIDPKKAPLTVWINGGPGSSSMIGLWQELGPCWVDSKGKVRQNEFAWNRKTNLLVVDQPAQVGFSYSVPVNGYAVGDAIITLPGNSCPDYAQSLGTCGTYSNGNILQTSNSTLNAAPNFWKTLQGFMGAFPQYSRNGFHFATESYGGHYGPIFNEYLERQNAKNIPGAKKIKLETVLIGNGWYDPLTQYQAFYNFTVSPGNTYNYDPFSPSQKAQLYNSLYGRGNCIDRVKECYARGLDAVCASADAFCATHIESFYDQFLGRDEYDIRELTPDPFPYGYFEKYLNRPEVLKGIGAYTNFTMGSEAVWEAFTSTGDDNREAGVHEAVYELLQQGVSVIMYAGDADFNCNWLGGERVAEDISPAGYDKAAYANIITSDGVVHGQVKQAGKFAFVRIYDAGHEVPFYQPLVALELFTRSINGLDIETGKVKVDEAYRTKGTKKSEYRQGNATMVWNILPWNATYNTTTGRPNYAHSLIAFDEHAFGGELGEQVILSGRGDAEERKVRLNRRKWTRPGFRSRPKLKRRMKPISPKIEN